VLVYSKRVKVLEYFFSPFFEAVCFLEVRTQPEGFMYYAWERSCTCNCVAYIVDNFQIQLDDMEIMECNMLRRVCSDSIE